MANRNLYRVTYASGCKYYALAESAEKACVQVRQALRDAAGEPNRHEQVLSVKKVVDAEDIVVDYSFECFDE